jgi:hypothetical protein
VHRGCTGTICEIKNESVIVAMDKPEPLSSKKRVDNRQGEAGLRKYICLAQVKQTDVYYLRDQDWRLEPFRCPTMEYSQNPEQPCSILQLESWPKCDCHAEWHMDGFDGDEEIWESIVQPAFARGLDLPLPLHKSKQ